MSGPGFLYGREALHIAKRKGRNDWSRAEVTREAQAEGGVPVTVYTSAGARMFDRVGYVTPDGTRCYVKVFGERVQATQESGRWVYRVPATETT